MQFLKDGVQTVDDRIPGLEAGFVDNVVTTPWFRYSWFELNTPC